MKKQTEAPVSGLDLVVSHDDSPETSREKSCYSTEIKSGPTGETMLPSSKQDRLKLSQGAAHQSSDADIYSSGFVSEAESRRPVAPLFITVVSPLADGLHVSHSWKDASLGPEYHDGYPTRGDAEAAWAEAHFKANLMADLAALDLALDLPMLRDTPRPRRAAGWAAAGVAESKWRGLLAVAELDGGTSQAAAVVESLMAVGAR